MHKTNDNYANWFIELIRKKKWYLKELVYKKFQMILLKTILN